MSDKIRIVGSFGDGAVEKVQEFIKGLDGVSAVSVLRDGIETYPDADSVKQAETETEPETPEVGLPPDEVTAESGAAS